MRLENVTGIYVVTDPDLRPDRSHEAIARAALEGGARVVQLRDKSRPTGELVDIARAIRALTRAWGAAFLVNDHVEVALAADADGAHIGQGDLSAAEAHAILGPDRLLGVSVATPQEADAALPYACYFGVGAVFGTATKPDVGEPIGLHRLAAMRAAYPTVPIVAIGGIGRGNIAPVAATGVASAAVVSAVVCADDMAQATRDLVALWNRR